jgi:hypothetical protein
MIHHDAVQRCCLSEVTPRYVAIGAPREPAPFDAEQVHRLVDAISQDGLGDRARTITYVRQAPADVMFRPRKTARRASVAGTAIAASIATLAVLATQGRGLEVWRRGPPAQQPAATAAGAGAAAVPQADTGAQALPSAVTRPAPSVRQLANLKRREPRASALEARAPAARPGPAGAQLAPAVLTLERPVQAPEVGPVAAVNTDALPAVLERLPDRAPQPVEPELPPGQLLVVSGRTASQLLGGDAAARQASGLGDIRSSNPLRMASAITGGAR